MKTVAHKTLGCKVNLYDTQSALSLFKEKGYTIVDFDEKADVYLINTCTVTNGGDKKSRQVIKRTSRENPNSILAVMGCYSQLNSEKVSKIEGVDVILGTNHRDEIVDLVEKAARSKEQYMKITNIMKEKKFEDLDHTFIENKTRGFVKIQDGCNNFCTFCIIPWARGQIRSRNHEDIISDIKNMTSTGIKEIILTGIHTGGYGEDLENYSLNDLLKEIEQIDNLQRYRISSIEINQLTNEVLETLEDSKKFAHHLHIPIQSGSDSILEKMRRNYNMKMFKLKIAQIRNIFPDIMISTDLIVGFPGEDEIKFKETCDNIKDINFGMMHVFPYSEREGTPAARMDNKIDNNIRKEYTRSMIELNDQLLMGYSKKFIGKKLNVLVEKNENDTYYGYTENYLYVKIENEIFLKKNEIYPVEISDYNNGHLIGKIISSVTD